MSTPRSAVAKRLNCKPLAVAGNLLGRNQAMEASKQSAALSSCAVSASHLNPVAFCTCASPTRSPHVCRLLVACQ